MITLGQIALPAPTRIDYIQGGAFASLDYVFDVAISEIKWHHSRGNTRYGLLCGPFKLNGAWTYACGGGVSAEEVDLRVIDRRVRELRQLRRILADPWIAGVAREVLNS